MNFERFIPALDWGKKYNADQFKGDLSAGLTVGVMLIPQGMAYAMIAGLPPIYGLYASTIPLIVYALLGTSRQLAVGPVAMVSLLTATGIGVLAEAGSETYIALAITLALLVGLIQFLLGLFRLGFLVNFLSHPVISGFTSAAALIIGLSQLKHLLGVNIPRSHHIHEILFKAVEQIEHVNLFTISIGLVAIAIILILKKINKSIPGTLIAVIFGIAVVWLFGLADYDVKIVGTVPEGIPGFSIPDVDLNLISTLLPIALAISLVSFMESIAVAKAIQAKHRNYKVIPNQELIALGLANVTGSFFQSFPVTGGFSRTAVNDQAGAKTGFAAVISAILIVLTLLFFTPLFYYLPKAILASVIMVAVFGLIDIQEAKNLWHTDKTDFWMLVVTFLATLSLGIEKGIGFGVVLSLAMVIFRTTRPHIAVLGKVPGTHFYRNNERFKEVECKSDMLIVRFDASLYFANTAYFKDSLYDLVNQRYDDLKLVILDFESISHMDSSALHAMDEVIDDLYKHDIDIFLSSVKGPVRDTLSKGHLLERIGEDHFFMSIQDAVDCYENGNYEKFAEKYQSFTLQSNS